MKALIRSILFVLIALSVFSFGFGFGYREALVIKDVAEEFGIPPNIAYAIVDAESSGFRFAIGRGGERGLFQITERTWKALTDKPFWMAFDVRASSRVAMRNLSDARTSDPKRLVSYHNAGTTRWEGLDEKWTVNHPNQIYRAIYRGELL